MRRRILGLLGPAALGAALATWLTRPGDPTWWLVMASVVLAWTVTDTWQRALGGGAALRRLERRWLALPGAERHAGAVHVHDGHVPVTVRLSRHARALRALVQSSLGPTSVALRVWPPGVDPPPLDPAGGPVGGPPVERAPFIEARFAGLMRVDSSDADRAARILGGEAHAAILAVSRDAGPGFGGLTYDGQILGVHFLGLVASDPTRAMRLARALRERIGRDGEDEGTRAIGL